jgi:hypothetical protein
VNAGAAGSGGVLDVALRFRSSGYRFTQALGRPHADDLRFVWELGEIAARGGDIRPRVRVLGLD